MRLLVIEIDGDLNTRANGISLDPFEAMDLKARLRLTYLVSEEINYDSGAVRLVFDLDRVQDRPNFTELHRPV